MDAFWFREDPSSYSALVLGRPTTRRNQGEGRSAFCDAKLVTSRTSLTWLFEAYRAGNIGGVDVDGALYRSSVRRALLASPEPDAAAVVAALDARF